MDAKHNIFVNVGLPRVLFSTEGFELCQYSTGVVQVTPKVACVSTVMCPESCKCYVDSDVIQVQHTFWFYTR